MQNIRLRNLYFYSSNYNQVAIKKLLYCNKSLVKIRLTERILNG